MSKAILLGIGRLGFAVSNIQDIQIVAGVDIININTPFPLYKHIIDCKEQADLLINCMPPTAEEAHIQSLEYAENHKLPVIIATTGLQESVLDKIKQSSKIIPILHSPNMSIGINILVNIIDYVAKALFDAGFDIEIIEKHHNKKLDAPSGTALLLADTIKSAVQKDLQYVVGGYAGKRKGDELGIHAVRGGSITGEHSIIFAGSKETIELNHIAYSRDVFAEGMAIAAKWIIGKKPDIYTKIV